jgi:membrane-associated phospholipid phosphatase
MFSKVKTLIFGVMLILPVKAMSFPSEGDRVNSDYLKGIPSHFWTAVSSPSRWSRSDLTKFFAVLGVGGGLYFLDQDIRDWSEENKSSDSKNLSRFVGNLGDGVFLGGMLVSMYLGGELANNASLRKTAMLGVESYLISGAMVMAGKFIVGRARPRTGENHSTFRPFGWNSGYYSFPSGHSAAAFSVAAVIADQADHFWVDAVVYSLSSLVAVSRIHDNKHWISDAFIGSALGFAVGKMVCKLHRDGANRDNKVTLSLIPHSNGMSLRLAF